MLINLHPDADVTQVAGALTAMGVWPKPMKNADHRPVGVWVRHRRPSTWQPYMRSRGSQCTQAESPHPLVDAARHTSVRVGSVDLAVTRLS